MKATSASLAAVVLVATGFAHARAEETAARRISVDATVTVGALRPLSGVQAADAEGAEDPEGTAHVEGTALYRSARIDLVRIGAAAGAADIDAIFPDMGADAQSPKSYHFAPADRLVASIRAAGAEPLFRVGQGAKGGANPPADLDKWAQIVRHVVLHYNAAWNKGFRHAIRYWEVWNSPDSALFWHGTPDEYYTLYAKTAQAIQAADASALVGGPAISKPLIAGAYREKFMDFVRVNRLPLDFFSWHFYAVDSNDPYLFVTIARHLRAILDAHGFGSTKNVLDQWNADPADRQLSNAARAAFAVSSLIYMLGGPVDAQTFHAVPRTAGGLGGEVDSALGAFGALKGTPVLIRTDGGDEAGFAVVAGRSKDSRLIQILISNYQIAAKYLRPRDNWDTTLPERRALQYHDNGGYDATISVPTAGKYLVKRYRTSDSSNFALTAQSVETGPTIRLQAALAPPAVELIVIGAK
jgi:xylan 1,4-beta-xylosidase